ncbi:transglutaminase domain-containing protein [Plebeiibacterium sediminum]|uniref:Transglutaminase-like domain-containing protein n=1 Tax=Plebeiibacterium sediminum TaxID=2992112 RepID=A0AAE3M5W9_9BACT|nr:transglutaminase domain-containing protein [Plebeiobacterium sediminum]MCW3787415.1 hypothetical protein [Plebeiobacterium sediminum]
MKAIIISALLILTCTISYSQNYKLIDEKVKTYPTSFNKVGPLSQLINQDFKTQEEKARAIYTWIALNISYDVKMYKTGTKPIRYSYRTEEERIQKVQEIEENLAKQTLKTRKAVCHGYSTLFKILCQQSGIECELISGASKTKLRDIGIGPTNIDHSWNAVKISNEWKLIDATWAAGFLDGNEFQFKKEFSDLYFFTDPDRFFFNHFPQDKKWLLTDKKAKDFAQLPLFYRNYLNSDIELIKPYSGILKIKRGHSVTIVLKNSAANKIGYNYSGEKKAFSVDPKIKGDLCYYNIKAGSGTHLTIYSDNSSLISFKIQK